MSVTRRGATAADPGMEVDAVAPLALQESEADHEEANDFSSREHYAARIRIIISQTRGRFNLQLCASSHKAAHKSTKGKS